MLSSGALLIGVSAACSTDAHKNMSEGHSHQRSRLRGGGRALAELVAASGGGVDVGINDPAVGAGAAAVAVAAALSPSDDLGTCDGLGLLTVRESSGLCSPPQIDDTKLCLMSFPFFFPRCIRFSLLSRRSFLGSSQCACSAISSQY